MQVNYKDRREALEDFKELVKDIPEHKGPLQHLSDKVRDKMEDPAVKSVSLHKPGSVITMSDGRKYRVDKSGSWRKFDG